MDDRGGDGPDALFRAGWQVFVVVGRRGFEMDSTLARVLTTAPPPVTGPGYDDLPLVEFDDTIPPGGEGFSPVGAAGTLVATYSPVLARAQVAFEVVRRKLQGGVAVVLMLPPGSWDLAGEFADFELRVVVLPDEPPAAPTTPVWPPDDDAARGGPVFDFPPGPPTGHAEPLPPLPKPTEPVAPSADRPIQPAPPQPAEPPSPQPTEPPSPQPAEPSTGPYPEPAQPGPTHPDPSEPYPYQPDPYEPDPYEIYPAPATPGPDEPYRPQPQPYEPRPQQPGTPNQPAGPWEAPPSPSGWPSGAVTGSPFPSTQAPGPAEGEFPGYRGSDVPAEPVGVPAVRHVNIVAVAADGRAIGGAVEPGRPYTIRVWIGSWERQSIVAAGAPAFPARHLGAAEDGWWLQAVLSEDGRPIGGGAFYLPVEGASFVCRCAAGGRHTCTPPERVAWLALTVAAPVSATVQRLQLAVHFEVAAVQAFEIVAAVGMIGAAAPVATAVYTLSTDLESLGRFAGRSASIRSGAGGDGRHYFVVKTAEAPAVGFTLADAQAGTAARSLRATLFDRQLTKRWRGWASRYDHVLSKPAEEYRADLLALARAGSEAYAALLPDPAARQNLRDALATQDDEPPVIQVAQAVTARAVVPWQLIYDEPIIHDAEDLAVCRSVWEFGPGAPARDIPVRCPYENSHGAYPGTLCPFGFWGFADVLEVPPSSRVRTLAGVTGSARPPNVVVALNPGLAGGEWNDHLAALDRLGGDRRSVVATDVASTRTAVMRGADLLYFLCHGRRVGRGGSAEPGMALDLGRGGRLTAQDVTYWSSLSPRVEWTDRRPFVVLNGCHTGERLPETLTDFVSAFVESTGAAGVLATEVAMERRLALLVMSEFATAWGSGIGVGAAVRRMRWNLLRRGNVMGLAYSPYCDAHLRLPQPERRPA